jgi:hypothetical protein
MYDLRTIWDEEWRKEAVRAPGLICSDERIQRVGIAAMLRAQELVWEEINGSCGCVFCDIGLKPFKAEKLFWHKANGRDPVRCTQPQMDLEE